MNKPGLPTRVFALLRPLMAAFVLAASLAGGAFAQEPAAAPPPDRLETARLVWSTLIAIDQANRTGNYTVLRDLAAPGFRTQNDAARLASIFASIRAQDLGLGRVVLMQPVYAEPPAMTDTGYFRIRGAFPTRPVGIGFEMLFQFTEGDWKLFGISVAPVQATDNGAVEAAPAEE